MSAFALTVLGVQPLHLRKTGQIVAFASTMDGRAEDDIDLGDAPHWVAELESLYPNRHFHYRRLAQAASLECDGIGYALSAYLCSNTVLNQHVVIFELHADTVDPARVDAAHIRSLLIKPERASDDARPPVVKRVIDAARTHVIDAQGRRGNAGHWTKADLLVAHDSCNITLFLESDDPVCILSMEDKTLALDPHAYINDAAERMTADRVDVRVSNQTQVFFGGRVHHVISSSANDMHVIKLIMLMLQVMYIFVPTYLRAAARWHRQMLDERSGYRLDELERAAQRLIHIYQTVHLQNEFAKYAYGVLCGKVYAPCERRWGVERSINQFGKYATFFREFIREVRDEQSRRSERLLNYVLAALGLFGIVGLWADILDSQVAAGELSASGGILHAAATSPLGMTTMGFIVVSLIAAVCLIVWSIRIRRGHRRPPPARRRRR